MTEMTVRELMCLANWASRGHDGREDTDGAARAVRKDMCANFCIEMAEGGHILPDPRIRHKATRPFTPEQLDGYPQRETLLPEQVEVRAFNRGTCSAPLFFFVTIRNKEGRILVDKLCVPQ